MGLRAVALPCHATGQVRLSKGRLCDLLTGDVVTNLSIGMLCDVSSDNVITRLSIGRLCDVLTGDVVTGAVLTGDVVTGNVSNGHVLTGGAHEIRLHQHILTWDQNKHSLPCENLVCAHSAGCLRLCAAGCSRVGSIPGASCSRGT